ncbi:MAG: hypothetical protein K8L97_09125 [Anaerolineae bacterium]|nr:hypothetical protein [Anaerolineae bacterium]
MSASFLSNFMRVALEITGAERAVACNSEAAIVDLHNIEQVDVLAEAFTGLDIVRQVLRTGEPVITNNAVSNLHNAPVTNTNFSNLRVIVVIPIPGVGAVYLDQPIRKGVIAKEVVDRLKGLGQESIQANHTEAELLALYRQMG